MSFRLTDERQQDFADDKAFFDSPTSFCLGSTMEDAGKIFYQYIEALISPMATQQKGEGLNVGMAD